MKKIIIPLMAIAAFSTACQVEDLNEANQGQQNGELFTIEAAITPSTKTSLTVEGDAYKVDWDADDALSVVAKYSDGTESAGFEFKKGEGNTFSGTVKNAANISEIHVVYPYNERHNSYNDEYDNVNGYITIGSEASGTQIQNGIDNTEHVQGNLYGYAEIVDGSATVNMQHATTLFEIILSNGTGSDIAVSQISLTNSENNNMVGSFYIATKSGTISPSSAQYVSSTANLTVEGNNTVSTSQPVKFYIVSAPFDLAVNENLTVTVTTADGKEATIVKTIPSADRGKFEAGKVNHINVEVTELQEIETIEPGNYAILAKKDNSFYALASTNTESDTRLDAILLEYNGTDGSIVTDNDVIVWSIEKNGISYTFANTGKYLGYSGSGNSAQVSEQEYLLNISKNDDGTYAISSATEANRILAKNDGSDFFAFYTGSQNNDLYLVPATVAVLPTISFEEADLLIEYNDNSTHQTNVTINDATSVTVNAYNDEDGTEKCDWLTVSYSDGIISYSATTNETSSARSAYIIVTATNENGTRSETIILTQKVNAASGAITATMTTFSETTSDNINGDSNVHYTCEKGGATTNPAIYGGEIRLYQGTPGGNITISAVTGYKIQSVTIGSSKNTSIKYEIDNNGTHLPETAETLSANGTYTLNNQNAESITFHCYGTDKNHRLYVNYLSVTYIAE